MNHIDVLRRHPSGATVAPAASTVGALIRDAKTYMLPGVMQTGKKQGMQLMDDALIDLYDRGVISGDEAYARAEQKQMMRKHVAA